MKKSYEEAVKKCWSLKNEKCNWKQIIDKEFDQFLTLKSSFIERKEGNTDYNSSFKNLEKNLQHIKDRSKISKVQST